MKKLLLMPFIAISFFSCNWGISKQDQHYIKTAIAIHNGGYGLRFTMDSLHYYNEFVMANAYKANLQAIHIGDSLIKVLYKGRNEPYQPEFDANLTYEKFIKYCRDKKYDPVLSAKLLH